MNKKVIFNNYQARCQCCGAALDADDETCPYCGINLQGVNEQYRNNDAEIIDVIEAIDNTQKRLKFREEQLQTSKKNNSGKKIFISIMIALAIQFILIIGISIVHDAFVSHREAQIEDLKDQLRQQDVKTIEIDAIAMNDIDFEKTNKQVAAGYLMESKEYFKIPFYDSAYSSSGVFKGEFCISKSNYEKIDQFDEYSIDINYKGCRVRIKADYSDYYKDPLDYITILYEEIDDIERLDNIIINDIIFECYKISNRYYCIANPYHDCFIELNAYDYGYDDVEFNAKDIFKIVALDCELDF